MLYEGTNSLGPKGDEIALDSCWALHATVVVNFPFACLNSLYSQHWENAGQIQMADLGWFLVGGYKGWELAVVENIVYASLFGGNFSPRWFSLTQWIRNPQSESISIFISSYFKFWPSHPGLLLPYDIRLLFHKGGRCLLTEHGCTLSETCLGTRKVSLLCFINFGMLYLAKKQDRQLMKKLICR